MVSYKRSWRKYLLAYAVVAVVAVAGVIAAPVSAVASPSETPASATAVEAAPAYYQVINKASGKCLTLWGSGDGAAVTQFTCDGAADQKWLIDLAAVGPISNAATGACLDLWGNSNADGQLVFTWTCYGAQSQTWRPTHVGAQYYELRAHYTDKCLDLLNGMTGDGATVMQWGCHLFNDNQQWRIVQ